MSPTDGRYRLLDHTADVRLALEGSTFADLIVAGCAGLFELVMGGGETAVGSTVFSVQVRPTDPAPAPALVEILNEALFQLTDRGSAPSAYCGDATRGSLECFHLPEGWSPIREVKAVTYERVVCGRQRDGTWRAEVTIDV